MSRAPYRKVGGKRGSGRFMVSEGVVPCGLPISFMKATPDSHPDFPIIMPDGSIYGEEKNEQEEEQGN